MHIVGDSWLVWYVNNLKKKNQLYFQLWWFVCCLTTCSRIYEQLGNLSFNRQESYMIHAWSACKYIWYIEKISAKMLKEIKIKWKANVRFQLGITRLRENNIKRTLPLLQRLLLKAKWYIEHFYGFPLSLSICL